MLLQAYSLSPSACPSEPTSRRMKATTQAKVKGREAAKRTLDLWPHGDGRISARGGAEERRKGSLPFG